MTKSPKQAALIFSCLFSFNNIPVLPASLLHNIGFQYRSHAQEVTVQ